LRLLVSALIATSRLNTPALCENVVSVRPLAKGKGTRHASHCKVGRISSGLLEQNLRCYLIASARRVCFDAKRRADHPSSVLGFRTHANSHPAVRLRSRLPRYPRRHVTSQFCHRKGYRSASVTNSSAKTRCVHLPCPSQRMRGCFWSPASSSYPIGRSSVKRR